MTWLATRDGQRCFMGADGQGYWRETWFPLRQAIERAERMSDRQLYDAVCCGSDVWRVAAILTERWSPPDLAGHSRRYSIGTPPLPWHSPHKHRRYARLKALVSMTDALTRT